MKTFLDSVDNSCFFAVISQVCAEDFGGETFVRLEDSSPFAFWMFQILATAFAFDVGDVKVQIFLFLSYRRGDGCCGKGHVSVMVVKWMKTMMRKEGNLR